MAYLRKSERLALKSQVDSMIQWASIAKSKGCTQDQILNFAKGGIALSEKQLEMAAAARACDFRCPECESLASAGKPIIKGCNKCGPRLIGVGGPRGGGKSQWMAAQVMLDDCQRYPGLKFLYVRKSGKSLRQQIRDLLKKTLPAGLLKATNYREQFGEIHFPNGSFIIIGHFKDESEIDNYLGQEYDGIAYEELTTLSADKFTNLNTCLRTSKPNWRPRAYAAWNWGGVGHSWVKAFFYDPWFENRQVETRYILSLCQDNKFNNPEYINDLQNLAGWKYQSWYLGDPNLAVGNFFSHYREDVHVFPAACPACKSEATFSEYAGTLRCSKCENQFRGLTFRDSDATRWFGSMDYGSSMPNCFHLHAENDLGDIFTVGEVHTIGQSIQENCGEFRDLLALHHVDVGELEFVAAGEDVMKGDRKTREDGSTIQTEFRENGIILTPIHIDRVNAFSQMQERLGDPDRGIRPTWFIHRSCKNLRTQIQTAQCDPKKPNDIIKQNADPETGEGGSDALESGRNGIVAAFNSSLTNAKPIQMGAWRGMKAIQVDAVYDPVQAEIEQSEAIEQQRRGI